jgi:prophage antirepressor-like protein
MTDIQIFNNPDFGDIRTVEIDGEAWFVGKDVAGALGYAKPLGAVSTHVEKDDSLKRGLMDSLGREQETIFINESGLYALIFGSKLDSAKKFKKWVTSEVLPAIRKNGSYTMPISTNDKIMLLAQGHMELQQEVDSIKKDMESLKMDLPILPVEEDRITSAVKRKGLAVMGGKTSNVYRDKSIRRKVYQGIYANLKYNFQIKTYRALKRSQVDKAIDIINNYQPPYVLAEQIDSANAQQTLIF